MTRWSSTLTHILAIAQSLAGAPPSPLPPAPECEVIQPPNFMRWLVGSRHEPFEEASQSHFFYVNQDVDVAGNLVNRVVQLVVFPTPPGYRSDCRLVFAMPEDAASWAMVQREGHDVPTLKVYRAEQEGDEEHIVMGRDPIGILEVKPGTQEIRLDVCHQRQAFIFAAGDKGRSRVAFRQMVGDRDGDSPFGAFMEYDCGQGGDGAMAEL